MSEWQVAKGKGVMVDVNCQLDKVWTYLGYDSGQAYYLDCVN